MYNIRAYFLLKIGEKSSPTDGFLIRFIDDSG